MSEMEAWVAWLSGIDRWQIGETPQTFDAVHRDGSWATALKAYTTRDQFIASLADVVRS